MSSAFRLLRRKIAAAGLVPRGALARIALYLGGIVALLLAAEGVANLFRSRSTGNSLGAWASGLSVPLVLLVFILLLRFIRRRILWRLRNRLIVTYVFIGVIPVLLLVAMGLLGGYFITGQFATFLATSDLQSELRSVAAANNETAAEIAAELRSGIAPERVAEILRNGERIAQQPQRSTTFWTGGHAFSIANGAPTRAEAVLPAWVLHEANQDAGHEFHEIVWNDGALQLTAIRTIAKGADQVVVSSSEPLDDGLLSRLAAHVGVISIYAPGGSRAPRATQTQPQTKSNVRIQAGDRDITNGRPTAQGGTLPPPSSRLDLDFVFGAPLGSVRDWQNGGLLSSENRDVVLMVATRKSILLDRLAATLGQFSNWVLVALAIVGCFFAIIELFALFIGIRLTRTITLSIYDLYNATQRVNRGDFTRRIPIRTQDQLAALGTSFNSMTESLQKLLAEQKEKQRIESELAIAQEVQNQLFPQQIAQLESLEVYGVCRPARTVSGDYYDFLPLAAEELVIAIGDISGKGISAALLMATLHSAVRSFLVLHSREIAAQPALAGAGVQIEVQIETAADQPILELAPAQWLELLNTHLFRSTPASKYATLFLGEYSGATRTLTYSNGGHLAPLILSPDGNLRRLETGGMVVGLFDGMQYEQESVQLERGDLFLSYSDGITEPENEFGEFGEERLIEVVREHAALPLDRIAEEVLTAVTDWIGGAEQPDDMTIVLARAR